MMSQGMELRVKKFATWPTACTPESVGDAARVLARLHSLPLQDAERTRFPDASATALLERWRGWSEGKGTEEFREALEAVGESLENVSSRPPALLHGDCHGGNFLTDGRKIVAVLDWESSAFGDPRIVLADTGFPKPAEKRGRRDDLAALLAQSLEPRDRLLDLAAAQHLHRPQQVGAEAGAKAGLLVVPRIGPPRRRGARWQRGARHGRAPREPR